MSDSPTIFKQFTLLQQSKQTSLNCCGFRLFKSIWYAWPSATVTQTRCIGNFTWFKSYLTQRRQCVKYNNVLSAYEFIKYGVPQGNVLGPTLYVIYVNDLLSSLPANAVIPYADDITLSANGSTVEEASVLIVSINFSVLVSVLVFSLFSSFYSVLVLCDFIVSVLVQFQIHIFQLFFVLVLHFSVFFSFQFYFLVLFDLCKSLKLNENTG